MKSDIVKEKSFSDLYTQILIFFVQKVNLWHLLLMFYNFGRKMNFQFFDKKSITDYLDPMFLTCVKK